MKLLEDKLQYIAAQWLRDNSIMHFHVPNEGKRTNGARLVAKGMVKGVSDLVIVLPEGKTLWVELKTKKGSLRPEQKKWDFMLKQKAHHSFLIQTDSPSELVRLLEEMILSLSPRTNIVSPSKTYHLALREELLAS